MAAESIYSKRKYGFPLVKESQTGITTTIEYVGATATLSAAMPEPSEVWGDYIGFVRDVQIEEMENTGNSTLTVEVEYLFEAGSGGEAAGTASSISYEIEWSMFTRSMYEHPQFAAGGAGANALTTQDIVDIQKWQEETNQDEKALYRYTDETADPPYVELSDSARLFARGIELGQEEYEDYAPIVRKTTTFLNGLPTGVSEAGAKDEPPSIGGVPTGYEWRKSADRFVTGSSRRKWDRSEEWVGAIRVLSDKNQIYWAAP